MCAYPRTVCARRSALRVVLLAVSVVAASAVEPTLAQQIGKRTQLNGVKGVVERPGVFAPRIQVGVQQFTRQELLAGKGNPALQVTEFPVQDSVYVIGDFSKTAADLRVQIQQTVPNARILEQTSNSVVIFADQQDAARLLIENAAGETNFVVPLLPERKLSAELYEAVRQATAMENVPPPSPNGFNPFSPVPAEVPAEDANDQNDGDGQAAAVVPGEVAIAGAGTDIEVSFQLFQSAELAPVEQAIRNSGGTVVASGEDETIKVVRARMAPSQVLSAAELPEVKTATSDPPMIKHNDLALRSLVRVPPAYVPPIHGEGQIVGHSDSGLDKGADDAGMHPAFAGRLKAAFALGRKTTGDWSDRGGHGSHTAGSILGCAQYPGIAPAAQLVHQSLDDADGRLTGIPTPLGDLFAEAYDQGARIHSDSWGASALNGFGQNQWGGLYTPMSASLDAWTWNNGAPRDMLIVYSAGNDGGHPGLAQFNLFPGERTLGAPATAKNCLTVGACENERSASPLGDEGEELAVFSSKGPTVDGRVKPDVVAPGTWIASAKTQGETIAWSDSSEAATAADWTANGGFEHVASVPMSGAFDGSGAWSLKKAAGESVDAILKSPPIAVTPGHPLFMEVCVRGDASALSYLRFGFGNALVAPIRPSEISNGWTVISVPLNPSTQALGGDVQFSVVAKSSALAGNVELFVDCFELTTFSSWGAISSLKLATTGDGVDRAYTFAGGTSMATPIVAGCATLVRQSLIAAGFANPSAELIKAVLINSADAHSGARPNFRAGWGTVNLRRALEGDFLCDMSTQLSVVDGEGQSMTYEVEVPAGTGELRATLVWADSDGQKLVRDLDLMVISPAGVERESVDPLTNSSPDHRNNVEGIDVASPQTGTWKVRVSTFAGSPVQNQPYALVVSTLPSNPPAGP